MNRKEVVEDIRTSPLLGLSPPPVEEHHEPFPFMVVNSPGLYKPLIGLRWTPKPKVSFIDPSLCASTGCSHLSLPRQQQAGLMGSQDFLPRTFCPAFPLMLDSFGKRSLWFLLKSKEACWAWISGRVFGRFVGDPGLHSSTIRRENRQPGLLQGAS